MTAFRITSTFVNRVSARLPPTLFVPYDLRPSP